jgi:DNA-directed RNA polymerase subunit RPC12/RpoP
MCKDCGKWTDRRETDSYYKSASDTTPDVVCKKCAYKRMLDQKKGVGVRKR